MSPFPVRDEMNASCRPSGEYSGRASFAGCDTSSDATPPVAGTVQISPPETNAISFRSGESDGSVKYGRACAKVTDALNANKTIAQSHRCIGSLQNKSVINPRSLFRTLERETSQTVAP